jgi:rubrerythrin
LRVKKIVAKASIFGTIFISPAEGNVSARGDKFKESRLPFFLSPFSKPFLSSKEFKMGNLDFSADEIFEMAQQIERNGARFYRRAASAAKAAGGAPFFLKLAAMEDTHEKIFARMRGELTAAERIKRTSDPENQGPAYLRAWADRQVFDVRSDPAERITGREEIEDIVRMAIGLEKDSVVFYLGMKDAVPERMGRSKVDEIIQEEMGHIGLLSRELQTLSHQML